jgi:hypothetical protein
LENIDESLAATHLSTAAFLIHRDVIRVATDWSDGTQISVPRNRELATAISAEPPGSALPKSAQNGSN